MISFVDNTNLSPIKIFVSVVSTLAVGAAIFFCSKAENTSHISKTALNILNRLSEAVFGQKTERSHKEVFEKLNALVQKFETKRNPLKDGFTFDCGVRIPPDKFKKLLDGKTDLAELLKEGSLENAEKLGFHPL